ncbi:MAG: glycosyltransferase [Eubacterium sp.]
MSVDSGKDIVLSLVIVAYENWKIVQDELDSLVKYNDLGNKLEVIVVDNSSEDKRIGKYIKEDWPFDYTYVLSENKGFGYGNNRGVELARGRIIGFVNPDILYIEPIFKKMVDFFDDPSVIMVGNRLLNADRKWTFSFYNDYRYSPLDKNLLKFYNKRGIYKEKKMYIAGCNMFVRKEDFIKAGMFDENIFMYYEEPDLIRRLRANNKDGKVVFSKDTHMIHLQRESTPQSDFAVIQEIKSCIYYGKKYNLNYKGKIKADYRYNKFISRVGKMLGRDDGRDKYLHIYEEFIEALN